MKDGDWVRILALLAISAVTIYSARKLEKYEASQK